MAAAVPAILVKSYGAGDTYTAGQVTTACKKLGLSPETVKAALAACCTRANFTALGGAYTAELFDRLRAEIAKQFDIDSNELSAEALRKLGLRPASGLLAPWTDDLDLGGGDGGHHH